MLRHKLNLRSSRVNKNGESAIYFIITANGTRSWIATGIFVAEKWWNKNLQMIMPVCPKAHTLTPILNSFKLRADLYFQKLYLEEIAFSEDTFHEVVIKGKNRSEENPLLVDHFKKYIDSHYLSPGREKHYEVAIKQLKLFRGRARVKEIGFQFLKDFEKYLEKQGNNPNTISCKMRMIKAVIHYAEQEGIIKEDPTTRYKISNHKGKRTALARNQLFELEKLYTKGEGMDAKYFPVLRYFLFSCYTGLRYGDIKTVKYNDIVDGCIRIDMHKTGLPVEVPLIPEAKALIDIDKQGHLFTVLCNEPTNRYLKEIAKAAGIKKNLTFHVARHTFATMGITLGIPIKVISEILGHKSVRTTELYLHIFNEMKRSEMSKWGNLRIA